MVYLLHFDTPYKHARHYLGYARGSAERRIEQHLNGQGARLMSVIKEAGIGFTVAKMWRDGTKADETRFKKGNNSPRLCPICQEEKRRRKWMDEASERIAEAITQQTRDRITEQYVYAARITMRHASALSSFEPRYYTLISHLEEQAKVIAHRTGMSLDKAYRLIEGDTE